MINKKENNIKMRISSFFAVLGIMMMCSSTSYAQKVTFNINLKPQLEDSVFIPGRDQIRIYGSAQPINLATPYYLIDEEPIDSVYSVTINFPRRYQNQTISFNYEMTINYRKMREDLERRLLVQQGDISLDALYFNAFAW